MKYGFHRSPHNFLIRALALSGGVYFKGEKGEKDKPFENVTCYHQKGRDAISLFKASSVAKEVYMLNGPLLFGLFFIEGNV